MIEPDINERMARFAPSQRGSFMQKIMEGAATPEQRDIEYPSMPDYTGAKIAEDVAAMAELSEPATPVRPMQSSPIAEDIAEQARQNLNASLVGVQFVEDGAAFAGGGASAAEFDDLGDEPGAAAPAAAASSLF